MNIKSFKKVIKMCGIIFVAVMIILLACIRNIHIPDRWGMVNTLSGEITGVEYRLHNELHNEHIEISLVKHDSQKPVYTYKHTSNDYNEEIISFETDEHRLDPFREICHTTECLIYNTPAEAAVEANSHIKETVVFHLGEEKIIFETSYNYPENCNEIYRYIHNAFKNLKEQYT